VLDVEVELTHDPHWSPERMSDEAKVQLGILGLPALPAAALLTVGHGTRTTDELASLLSATGVVTLIDVRRYPIGRRQPHLSRERLAADLPQRGIAYEWWGEALGGRRSATGATVAEETNRGLRAGRRDLRAPEGRHVGRLPARDRPGVAPPMASARSAARGRAQQPGVGRDDDRRRRQPAGRIEGRHRAPSETVERTYQPAC